MSEEIAIQPGKPCPICGKPATERYRPFCTKRCADVDLNRWFSGVYVVPATETEEDEKPAPKAEPGSS
jgi:endogenous inhibitor of DNA gyrase (YacG/DUF329 family)